MPFTSAVRQAFSSQKTSPSANGIYTQSPTEHYHRSPQAKAEASEPRTSRPANTSCPAYQHEVGKFTQSPSEVYTRRDSHRYSQPVELPPYQRAVAGTTAQPEEFYAPISEYVPKYYHREGLIDGKHGDGQPPKYQS